MRIRARVRLVASAVLLALGALVAGPAGVEAQAGSLADDGRVGVVTDLQGTALVRPAGRTRWSPVGPRFVLLPGDELRAMARGAHAAEVRLADGGSLVLGPGASLQFEARGKLRLTTGDAEIAGAAGSPVTVSGPGGFETKVEKASVLRAETTADGASTKALTEPPRWLTGYRASTTDEWMGSLLAQVDGRDVPLTVGYHRVGVTIRDQIAETTVEESFVNTTDSTLEGVFSFPLPAGASISGFGMWIGAELVEADIVERERARAIYEDILARRKDPGLLEWSGGNLFKASVFPIFAHSEKRIRLRYTQVLPLEGSVVRYRYALRSELLRTHPLRQLEIHVAAQSAAPIVSATSPTHEVRVTKTPHTATLDWSESEVTPDRDFEIALRLETTTPLRVVAHRRGDDGYLMALLAPPDTSSGEWKRELVPEGTPLDVMFVADTSGSMGPTERRAQRAFIEAALALLGPDDRFSLMACDAMVVWLTPEPLAVSEANAARAMEFLDRRWSLGWSDFDKAFAAVAERATAQTTVVYVGDGIGTSGDADPVALARRIGLVKLAAGASVHAVSPGTSYEQGVLEAMAARGGGSVRETGDDPARAAYALFSEVAQPAVKDLAVTFEGLRTARVYPAKLPNLPAGTQQIVMGRFLPEGAAAQTGRVKVTGTLGGKPVSYTADVTVEPGAEGTGNSFLPRLWARRHLDALLAEGRTPAIKDEIVAMSESYGIITPYTSFLVLENDEDRERYGVARRVGMRDGERFFTDGRTAAATEALRDQMQKARSWRIGLRKSMLAEIAALGRGLATGGGVAYALERGMPGSGGGRPSTGGKSKGFRYAGDESGNGMSASRPSSAAAATRSELAHGDYDSEGDGNVDALGALDGRDALEEGLFNREPSDPPAPGGGAGGGPSTPGEWDTSSLEDSGPMADEEFGERQDMAREVTFESKDRKSLRAAKAAWPSGAPMGYASGGLGHRARRNVYQEGAQSWLARQLYQQFPHLGAPPAKPPAPPENTWDAEIRALLASVAEPELLAPGSDARLEVVWQHRGASAAAAPGTIWPKSTGRALIAPDRWFVTTRSPGTQPYEEWLAQDRGILATGTRLGRRRPGAEGDRGSWATPAGRTPTDFARHHAKWTARIESRDGALVVVELTSPGDARHRQLVTIDTEKRLVVLHRQFQDGKPTWTRRLGGFVRAGGLWWATEETSAGGDGEETWRKTLTVREIPAAEFDAALAKALSGQEDVIFLGARDPSLRTAKQTVHEGRGTFADHLRVAAGHAVFQRWDDAWAAWEKARALVDSPAARRPGADWIEVHLLSMSRRGERFAAQTRALAESVAAKRGPAAHALARIVEQTSANGMSPDERIVLLDVLERAAAADVDADELRWQQAYWTRQRATVLAQAGRHAEAVAIWRALWTEQPADPQRIADLMNGLVNTGDVDGALELYGKVDLKPGPANTWIVQQFFTNLVRILGNAGRYAQALEVADRWAVLQPEQQAAWSARLTALLSLNRIEDFDRWIDERVAPAELPGGDPVRVAQLAAAIEHAFGQTWNQFWNSSWYGNQSDPKWVTPLAVLARRLSRDPKGDVGLAARIVSNHWWQRSDGHRQLRDWLREDLAAQGGVESPKPAALAQILTWVLWDRNAVDAALWRGVTDRVEKRWRETKDDEERQALLGSVLHLLGAHGEADEAVVVLREELAAAPPARVPAVADELLVRLVRTPWTQAMEDEAFALVPRLVTAEMAPDVRRSQFASSARWLVARLTAVRNESALPPQVEREKLPRAELRARQSAARTETRKALAARLAAETKGADALLRPWYEIERLCLVAELGADPAAVEAEARELLLSIKDAPAVAATGDGSEGDGFDDGLDDGGAAAASLDEALNWVLRERSVLVLSYVAVRREAPAGLAERVLALCTERLAKDEKAIDWRYAIFRLLVALDRPADLEVMLRTWIVPAKVESRWRRALGYVLAETGRLKEAAEQFEEVARLDELGEAEYVTLAGWYLVLGEDVRRDAALERRYTQTDEYALGNRVGSERYRIQSRGQDGVPPTMDDEVLRVIRVLLAKSTRPQNAIWQISGLYSATKDFRVLAPVADGVVGHTPEAVYGFLEAIGSLLREVHEEATCDEIRGRIEQRLATAKTDTDRRGLRLLMVQVERRAAEVLNQPGPHAARALADLRAARQGTWLPGERRLMAEYLASLARIPDAALAEEQVTQLAGLHEAETKGGTDRLRVAHALFRTHWAYDRRDVAIDGLVAALDEHRQARGGKLPPETNDLADTLTDWNETVARFAAGEAWLLAETGRQSGTAQRQWYERRTFGLWVRCLAKRGTVSLGTGEALYRAARERMERALADHAPDQLADVLASYCSLHRSAHKEAKVAGVGDDLVRFSRTLLPEVLLRFGQQASDQVRTVAEAVEFVAGPLPALTLLVERLESEPAWYASRGRGFGGWQHFAHRMSEWRRAQPAIGDLEPRLLAVVLRELERDLTTGEPRGRHLYGHEDDPGFWSAKADEFLRVARKVVEENPQAPDRLRHTAAYLWGGLRLKDEAVATLEAAGRRGALREDGRWILVQWEQELKRWQDSLPHAETLVAERPDNVEYRLAVIRALHGVRRDDDGRAFVDATRAHFVELRKTRRVPYGVSAQLADVCVACGYFDRAVALYPEAISERRRVTRGRADHELSRLWAAFARGLSGLGRHDEAVDAASSAVVIWGSDIGNREGALQTLRDVLNVIPDLPAWTKRWEDAALRSGLDAPVVRTTLARIHLDRKQPGLALHHLLVARKLMPDDAKVHEAVVQAFTMQNDAAGTADAIATSLQHLPKQPELYPRLAGILTGLGRADDAERALTGLAEYAPNDADGHRRLAEIRAQAARYAEAADQWRQVVRIRSTEPAGWLELALALSRAGRKDEARAALDTVVRAPWGEGQRRAVERVSLEIDGK